MQRMGMVIGLRADKVAEYKTLHAAPWPEMNAALKAAHISNYSIYLRQPENLLFGYWEYTGTDFAADGAKMAADPKTQEWWSLCMPMQEPLATRKEGEWWAMMEEVFHHD